MRIDHRLLTILVTATSLIVILSGCTSGKNGGVSSLSSIDSQILEEQSALDSDLAQAGLKFNSVSKRYSGEDNIFSPCSEDFQKALIDFRRRSTAIDNQVRGSGRATQPRYTGPALAYQQNEQAMKSSLERIVAEVDWYCSADEFKVSSCLGGSETVATFINSNRTPGVVLAPVAGIDSDGKVSVFLGTDQRARAVTLGDDGRAVDKPQVFTVAPERLRANLACLKKGHTKSNFARLLVKTLEATQTIPPVHQVSTARVFTHL